MKTIITNPNQRIITIERDLPKKDEKGGIFTVIKNENLYQACRNLNNSEFKLYITLVSLCSKDSYTLAFSPQYIHELTDMNEDTIRKAFKALADKHYIQLSPNAKNRFIFTDSPHITNTFKIPTLYIYFDGTYYTKQEVLEGNDVTEATDYWNSQPKFIQENGEFKPYNGGN